MDNVYPHLKPCGKKCSTWVLLPCRVPCFREQKSCRRETSCSAIDRKWRRAEWVLARLLAYSQSCQGNNAEDLLWIWHGPRAGQQCVCAHTNTRGHLGPAQEGHLEEWMDLSKGRLSFSISRFPGAEEGRSKWSAEMEMHLPSSKSCGRESPVWNPETQQKLSWKETPAERHWVGPENAVSSSQQSQFSTNIPAPLFFSPSSGHSHPGGVRTQVCNMGKEEKCTVGRGEEAICAPAGPDWARNAIHIYIRSTALTMICDQLLQLVSWGSEKSKSAHTFHPGGKRTNPTEEI